MTLDVRTAFVFTSMICVLGAITAAVLRHLHAPSRLAMVRLAAALAMGGAAAGVATTHGKVIEWVSTSLPICLAGATSALAYQAMRRLYEQPARSPMVLSAVVLQVLLVMLAPDGPFALVVHYGFQAAFALASLAVVARAHDPAAPRGRWMLVGFFSWLVGGGLWRTVRVLIGDQALPIADAHRELWATLGLAPIVQLLAPMVLMILVVGVVLARQLADLEMQASTDALTGAASRRHLFAHADRWLDRHARGDARVAVMMIDVDGFKAVNDRYGHPTGDRVLRHLAQVLERALPAGGVLARYGGEEFCALVPVSGSDDAERCAEDLRRAAEAAPYLGEEGTIVATVSIGVALRGEATADRGIAELLRIADRRVYRAKAEGRNRVAGTESPVLEVAVV